MSEEYDVAGVFGDIGSCREMLPALRLLEKRGVRLRYFVDSSSLAKAGTDVLEPAGIPYETRNPTPEDDPKVILCGTSATAVGAQIAWTDHTCYAVRLWREEQYGTGSNPKVDRVSCPFTMLVIDDLAAEIARHARPNLTTVVVGKNIGLLPTEPEMAEIRAKHRAVFGIGDEFFVNVAFGGDPPEMAEKQLPEVIATVKNFNCITSFRFHPKHPRRDQLMESVRASGIRHVDTHGADLMEINIVANAAIAGWGGNDPYKALLLGIPTVTLLFPDDSEARKGIGYINGVPPIVMRDEWWGARSPRHLRAILTSVIAEEEEVRRYTREIRALPFRSLAEPGSDQRIADAVMRYL